ncbi:MAG: caspase family protein [Albidovulum sp.]
MYGLRVAVVAVAFVLGLWAPGNAAEIRALLIGVSAYDESIGLASLRGPANDVRLWQKTLAERGISDIRVLADGVEGGVIPTHAAILGALADLARTSSAGDLAIITMSGHGTRQPDNNGDETDGLDELFLPADTARAQAGSNAIPNALLDDEIGDAVDAIRATGADVWLIMDSCHSGSGLRAASPDVASRFVDPALLGVSDRAAGSVADAGGGDTPRADLPGQVIAFYAARASEVAREVNLDPEKPDDSAWYGLFSSRLAARVAGGEGLSYRQLFQAVLSDMNAAGVPGGARMQTPSWEGTLGDAVVLGGRSTSGVRQFAVNGDEIEAGLVHGMGEGTLMSLFADAADDPDAVLGFAQMTEVSATQGFLRPVTQDCEPRTDRPCDAAGALPQGVRFARLAARPLDLVLRIAPPRDLATGVTLPPESVEFAALDQAIGAVNAAGNARVEMDADGYTIDVALADGALWFGRRVVAGTTPVGLEWRPDDGTDLATLLTRIAAAERLATMLSSVAGGGSLLNPSPVRIDPTLVPSDPADLDPLGMTSNPVRECRRALQASARTPPVPLPEVSDLKQCDNVSFAAQGEIPGERDVNRIHIDARFCVHADYVHVEDTARPVPVGNPMVVCSDCPDGKATGDERLFVIVTESPDNAERLNLESMLETCTADGAAPTRGSEAIRVAGFLEALGRRPDTRGAFGGLNVSNVWVEAWEWQVLPKEMIASGVK